MRVRIAWSLLATTMLVSVVHVLLLAASERPMFHTTVLGDGFPLVTVGALAGAGVGAAIISRYPGHPIGWLLLAGQLLSELGLALRAYGHSALAGELGPAPGGEVATWMSIQTGGLFVVALLAVLFLLAPDGRPASPRWRLALALPVTGLVMSTVAVGTVSPTRLDPEGQLEGGPSPLLEAALVTSFGLVCAGMIAAAVSLTLRLRRARGEERQQLRWVAIAALGLAVGVVANLVLFVVEAPEWVQPLPVMVGYVCVPVFMGIAILRYRLYEIDIFLNRSIVLAGLTGLVTVGYVGIVVVMGRVFPMTDGEFWPSLLATAVVAIAIQPVRAHATRLSGRIVYGARAAPYVDLANFSKRLQEAPSTQELLRRVGEAVGLAVDARSTTIRAHVPGGPVGPVIWPDTSAGTPGPAFTLPVLNQGELLGELTVNMPPGRSLRAEEERLLADFAVQLGHAFRNIGLESSLAQRLADLRASAAALEASTRRLDLAQEAERQRFETDLARWVVPHLRAVQQRLAAIPPARGDVAGTQSQLDELHHEVQLALEGLRTLTRGVFPAQLERQGLPAALAELLARGGYGPVHTDLEAGRRFDPEVESAAYLCVAELVRLVDSPVGVRLREEAGHLTLQVRIQGPAPVPLELLHLQDRAAALAGQLTTTWDGGASTLTLRLPVDQAEASLQT
jgi:signal transduction histidine kinase